MHPSALLIVWIGSVLIMQRCSYAGLMLFALLVLATTPASAQPWLRYVWRARWLLLSLWLILAYNTPGDAFMDVSWAPTHEGVAEATLHAMRLILMLGALACLFVRLNRDGLVTALWGLTRPLARLGCDARRFVLRLSLVLANLENPHNKDDWKNMLFGKAIVADGPDLLRVAVPAWTGMDWLGVIGVSVLLIGAFVG